MIIFYNKKTGNIFGKIDGRVHTEERLKMWIQPSNVAKKDIVKYVVPFKPNLVEEEVPITEWRMVDEKTKKVKKVVVRKEKQMVTRGVKPAVPFADFIYDFESGKRFIHDYKVKLKNGKVVGFERKKEK